MKTHQHAHSSTGQEKYLKKEEKKLTFFGVTLLFAEGDRLRTLETSVSLSASSQSKNKHLSIGEGQKYT